MPGLAAKLRTLTLPHGLLTEGGKVSVYFAPRLQAGTGPKRFLADFPEWLEWPTTLAGLLDPATFEITAQGVPLTWSIPPDSVDARLDVWQALFPPDLVVESPDSDRPQFQGTRFEEREFAERLTALYTSVARGAPNGPPTAGAFLNSPQVTGLFQASGALGSVAQSARSFIGSGDGSGPGNTDDAQDPVQWDFHQWVSVLGQYPELLRLLGIVVDLEVSNPPLPAPGQDFHIETRTAYPNLPIGGRDEEPVPTKYDNSFWWATCDPTDNRAGFLSLGNGLWSAIDIDPLQSIQTLAGFSRELVQGDDGQAEARLPALWENGWSIVRDEAADRADQKFRSAQQLQDAIRGGQLGPEVAVCTDQITLGYRLDVRVDGGSWRSLHQRTVKSPSPAVPTTDYLIGRDGGSSSSTGGQQITHAPADDEGWITTTILSTGQPNAGVLRDQLVRWDGWSLSVNAYGSLVDPATGLVVPSVETEAAPNSPVQFTVDHAVPPGSLPPLQYGREYEFRVRLVDITGVSKELEEQEPAGTVLGPVRYGRWHPVGAPTVIRRVARPDPGVGDVPQTLVITSELGQAPGTVTATERLLFPPDTSWKTCELHREPDGGHDPSSYTELTERDARSLEDQTIVDPDTGELLAPGLVRQQVEYLSDPATDGVGIVGLPRAPRLVSLPYGAGGWPTRSTARLVLQAGPTGTQVSAGEAVVQLQPAQQLRIQVGSAIAPAHLRDFGIYQQLEELGLPTRQLSSLRNRILAGQHWLFSGIRELELVHAVRLPLQLPEVVEHDVQRDIGDQTARIRLRYDLDAHSTREVSAEARWTDPVDLVTEPAPIEVDGAAAIAASDRIAYDDNDDLVAVDGVVDFFDTKRHDLLVDAEVLARFSRYFTEETTLSFGPDVQQLHGAGVVWGSVRVVDTSTDTRYRRGVDFDLTGTNGSMFERLSSGSIPSDGEVLVSYVPLPISRRTDDEGAAPYELTVPNTVKPAPLDIDLALPAVKRTEEIVADFRVQIVHDGQQVRLWLNRPWYDTGVGELVGVLIDENQAGVPETTTLARDVVFPSADVGPPVRNNFPNFVEIGEELGPEPLGDGETGPWLVLGHPVVYHEESERWRCDIAVDDAPVNDVGYRPFVQLHVARYQPESLNGVWLSNVQVLDPIQLGVKRTIDVSTPVGAPSDLHVAVSINGTGHDGVDSVEGAGTRFNEITVFIQEADPAVADEDLRWATLTGPGNEIVLTRTVDIGDAAGKYYFWSTDGDFLDFTPYQGNGLDYRILIEERQPTRRRTDDDTATVDASTVVMSEVSQLPPDTQAALA